MIRLGFEASMKKYRIEDILREKGTVIVGYSGGADSTCLLRHMNDWCGKNGVRLCAAHVNHMIRGEEADGDENFCRKTCDYLGIELFVKRADVPQIAAQSGKGLEEAAREVRYSFFDEISEKITGRKDGAAVATAHSATDSLETVIFNLMRGSGTKGLCGIPPVRDGRFVRPLIDDSSADIRQWCAENGAEYVIDSTNADTEYKRNRIRNIIVPELRKLTSSPEASVSRMTSVLRTDEDYFDTEASKYYDAASASADRGKLRELHPALLSRVLRGICSAAGCYSTEENHIASLMRIVTSDKAEAEYCLPGGFLFVMTRTGVRVVNGERDTSRRSQKNENETLIHFVPFEDGDEFANELYIARFSHDIHTVQSEIIHKGEIIYKLFISKSFTSDKISGELYVRYRLPGDTLRNGGMTHKVKTLFSDRKMGSEEKTLIPIVCDGEGILFIPGFSPRDRAESGEGEPLTISVYKRVHV